MNGVVCCFWIIVAQTSLNSFLSTMIFIVHMVHLFVKIVLSISTLSLVFTFLVFGSSSCRTLTVSFLTALLLNCTDSLLSPSLLLFLTQADMHF